MRAISRSRERSYLVVFSRMAETGENYTVARRAVIAARDPGQRPVALRVHLNPYVDLELTPRPPGHSRPLMSKAAGPSRTGCWPTT